MGEEIVLLDLDEVELYGFERCKSLEVVDYYMKQILQGEEFPPVKVYRIDDSIYQLTTLPREGEYDDGYDMDGGHLRALAHYLAGKPLKCRNMGTKEKVEFRFGREPIDVREIQLIDDDEAGSGAYPAVRSLDSLLEET